MNTHVDVDPEVIGHRLDMSRAELLPLMVRYVPRGDADVRSLLSPPTALVVTTYEGEDLPLRAECEAAGWSVRTCRGPGGTACPLMRGEPCALRASADVAIVFTDPRSSRRLGMLPRARCAADSASPGVIALEGRLDSPEFAENTAVLGAWRGPRAIVKAARALLATRFERDR